MAEMHIDVDREPLMITKGKAVNTGRSVLLFSAGMDSLMMAKLLHPGMLLNIEAESSYSEMEKISMENLQGHGYVPAITTLHGALNLKCFERDDLIVPNRNAHLVMLAANYGETIYIGAVSGDRSTDKDHKFCRLMENLLNHMNQEQHWTNERKFKVLIPFKNKTKTQLVKEYLAAGGSKNALLESYSCYKGANRPCGICKPCFRKWVALTNNKVEIPIDYFAQMPYNASWLKELLPLVVMGRYRGAEDRDWISALRRAGR